MPKSFGRHPAPPVVIFQQIRRNICQKGGLQLELSNQIKKYRKEMNLSQEELAEQVYVSRQTISNWETNKNYPDIHSLLLLSSFFHISLDQLIKGDIETMKEELNKEEIQKFNRYGTKFTVLLLLFLVSAIPLVKYFQFWGLAVSAVIYTLGLYYAIEIEKYKKKYNIQTYKEILAFTEGKKLDEIEKAKEYGKRPYQKVLLALFVPIVTFFTGIGITWLVKYLFF